MKSAYTAIWSIIMLLLCALSVGFESYAGAVWFGGMFFVFLSWTLVLILDEMFITEDE